MCVYVLCFVFKLSLISEYFHAAVWYFCIQDWYWYTLISYCISNNAYIGCDPPDVGQALCRQSPGVSNEVLADSSVENVDTDSRPDFSVHDSMPVCDDDDDDATQPCIVTSFLENGFVDNLSELTADDDNLLQLDGPIDKYPCRQQSGAAAQSADQSTVVVSDSGQPEVIPHCSVESVGIEAESRDMNHYCDIPLADAVVAGNCTSDSVSAVGLIPAGSPRPANDPLPVASCIQETMNNDMDVPVPDTAVADKCTFDSVTAVSLVSAGSPPPPSVNPSPNSCMQESVNNDTDVPVADMLLADDCTFDSVTAVSLVSPLPPHLCCVQESVNSDENVPVADAENCAFAISALPTSSPPPAADVYQSVASDASEHSTVDQLSCEMADVDDAAVSQPQDKSIPIDTAAQCLDVTSLLSDNDVVEMAAAKPVICSDILDCNADDEEGRRISETNDAASLSESLPCSVDPVILGIINSVERSLTEHAARVCNDESDRQSQCEAPVVPISVELQQKIIRQMEVCVDNNSGNTACWIGWSQTWNTRGIFFSYFVATLWIQFAVLANTIVTTFSYICVYSFLSVWYK